MAGALPTIRWMTYMNVAVDRVFATLTTAEGWDAWFTRGATLEPRVGGHITLRWTDAERIHDRVTLWGPVHTGLEIGGPVVAIEPAARFAFEWTTAGHPTTVDFRLEPRADGTIVTITESGYTEADLSPSGIAGSIDNRSPFAMCASGWGEALTLLKFYLEHGVTYGSVPSA
jgi:uncharacterized protein YndB with AHSA1/START domain